MVRIRIILTILVSILVLTSVLYTMSKTVLTESYLSIEEEQMLQNLERVDLAISNYRNSLNVKLRDWAQWDDTYNFIQGNDPTYADINLGDGTLINLEINLMAFVDEDGTVRYSKYIDLQSESELPSSEIMKAVIASSLYGGPETRTSGILQLPEGLLLLEGLPALYSDGSGTPRGTVYFGKFIEDSFTKKISELTRLSVAINEERTTSKQGYNIVKESEETIYGSFPLIDGEGEAIAEVSISYPRTIYTQGKNTVSIYVILSSAAIVLFGLVILFLFEYLLLRRLSRMGTEVDTISADNLDKAQVSYTKDDDIGKLGQTINQLLGELSKSQRKVKKAAAQEALANEKLKKSLEAAEEMNKLMVGRELKMIELKERLAKLENVDPEKVE
jgi:sensor domain CHASE-containing protein